MLIGEVGPQHSSCNFDFGKTVETAPGLHPPTETSVGLLLANKCGQADKTCHERTKRATSRQGTWHQSWQTRQSQKTSRQKSGQAGTSGHKRTQAGKSRQMSGQQDKVFLFWIFQLVLLRKARSAGAALANRNPPLKPNSPCSETSSFAFQCNDNDLSHHHHRSKEKQEMRMRVPPAAWHCCRVHRSTTKKD